MTATSPGAQQRILLIDDDELIAGSLRSYLVMNGREVDVATDGPEAERLMKSARYDVIIFDPYLTGGVHHPPENVIECVARLQPDAALIVLTAYSSPEWAQVAAESRIAALLTKPQSVVTLNDLVLNLSRAPQPAAIKG
jgi:DNA-binding NarL/FixJ family response regulator